MNEMVNFLAGMNEAATSRPLNFSRRGFLGASLGALVLGVVLPGGTARAQAAGAVKPGTRVPAFIEIRNDGTVFFRSPFIEGGQGIFTAMAQIVGEELDVDPQNFTVECAPAGPDYTIMFGGHMRITGGSFSVRSSYPIMRKLGAAARQMLLEVAAKRLDVPMSELTTEPGVVIHAASGRRLNYGDLAEEAATQPVPEDAPLKADADFRWIRKPLKRLDVRDKSTGKAMYSIDLKVDGMLLAAVQHAPRLGWESGKIFNEDQVKAMRGVHSIHTIPGAVAVVADRWWHAKRAAEALQVEWKEPAADVTYAMPADFSTEAFREKLAATRGPGVDAEKEGDVDGAFKAANKVIEAQYDAPYLAHGQLEPPSAIARWNEDGTLEIWTPNQAPEMFQGVAAKQFGLPPEKILIHSPLLGGFFGRNFTYLNGGIPFPQAALLAQKVGKPVKVIWSREDEFLRDYFRPMGLVRFRGGLDKDGMPVALTADVMGEGPTESLNGVDPNKVDPNGVEGIVEKPYAIPNRHIVQIKVPHVARVGYWRSVGHSMNDFFYETFFDEMADAGGHDPYELRHKLVAGSPRHLKLLETVAESAGGWKRGPFTAEDGSKRARGVSMASPFGSETASIAEVSIEGGQVVVHDVWVAIDPGSIVNPAIIEAQVKSATALGLSTALLEEVVYEGGKPLARNYDRYPILPLSRMARVHVSIVESGAPMGGVGEPGLPGVPPAVANAVSVLAGQRIRRLPLSRSSLGV
ncbi:molybdopterin cofactor-binding domain-containing protein [Radicibacter daui]|uniref:molybdopterin cofactor-binding domain-containing protein n=1 Tax=Radicibacter daui TaxID=3064829 RepID=UPI004046B413